MSARYQAPFTIPPEFPALLKGFTREVLRTQPEDIYAFGTQYFSELMALKTVEDKEKEGRAPGSSKPTSKPPSRQQQINRQATPPPHDELPQQEQQQGGSSSMGLLDLSSLSPQEIESMIMQLFLEADLDHSGYLDRHEFQNVLRSADLKLNEQQLRQVLAEADENEDNVIQYKEFLPVMVDILHGLMAKQQARAVQDQYETAAQEEAEAYLLHGLPKEEMEQRMLEAFRKADRESTGRLGYNDFKEVLREADLGLTRKDINLILSQLPESDDGRVAYESVIPAALQFMVDLMKDEIIMNGILNSEDNLQGLLLSHFKASDPENTGLLSLHSIKTILKDLSFQFLGLSTLQLMSLISQAPTTKEGMVQYVQFVPLAATMITQMYGADNMKNRLQAIREVSAAGGIQALSQMDIGGLRSLLEKAFASVDTDGSGQLSLDQVVEILSNVGTLQSDHDGGQKFSDAHMRTMFAAIDVDESGYVDWFELVNFICDAIEHLEREAYIEQVARNMSMGPIPEGGEEGEQQGAEQ